MADRDLDPDHRRLVGVTRWLVTPAALAAIAACGAPNDAAGPGTAAADIAAVPRRIVSLAPNLTELVYAVGAGDRLVGAVAYSDYPPAAREVPRVGDAFRLDYERIAQLRPDLVLAWQGGNPDDVIAHLDTLGYRVERFDPKTLRDIPVHLERVGVLLGVRADAEAAAARFRERLAALAQRHRDSAPLRVFFQVSERPLYTVGGPHTITEMLALCGGRNVFADLDQLAPVVELEAVIARDPQAIVATLDEAALDRWRRWSGLSATVAGALYAIDGDLVTRPGPRLIDGAEAVCDVLESARRQARPRFQSTS